MFSVATDPLDIGMSLVSGDVCQRICFLIFIVSTSAIGDISLLHSGKSEDRVCAHTETENLR